MLSLRKSFRIRIVILSVLLSGVVLLAFGAVTRYALYQLKLRSIDQSLRSAPVRQFPHPEDERIWPRLAGIMEQYAERFFGGQVGILVYGREEEIFFKSGNWPDDIALAELPNAEGELPHWEPRPLFGEDLDDIRRRFQRFEGPRPRRFLGGPPRKPELIFERERGSPMRIAVYRERGYNVALAVDLRSVSTEVDTLRRAFYWALPVALLILAGGSWIVASRALKPIRTLTETIKEVSAERLNARIAAKGEDAEFRELIDMFNAMLERLEKSFAQATRFSADAAHELKTPLAILQGRIEAALQNAADDSSEQKEYGALLEETQRLKSITSKLLLLSRADAGELPVRLTPVNLKKLVAEQLEDLEMQSPKCTVHAELAEVLVEADESLLERIAQNLLNNAVKYNDEKRPEIWIRLMPSKNGMGLLEIENSGELVEADQREALFDRFRRADPVRGRSVEGLGLGLSLSREFAKAMGGTLEWVESASGRNCFRLRLRMA